MHWVVQSQAELEAGILKMQTRSGEYSNFVKLGCWMTALRIVVLDKLFRVDGKGDLHLEVSINSVSFSLSSSASHAKAAE